MNDKDTLEKQKNCEHANTHAEVLMGQKTGDRICFDCGAVLYPGWRNDLAKSSK